MERTYESAAALVGRAAGPLAGHLGTFVGSLIDRQFRASVIYVKAQHALAFDGWLAKRGAVLADLGDVHIELYQQRRRRRHQRILAETWRRERNHIAQLLQFLRDRGACPAARIEITAADDLAARYERHLQAQQGLAVATIERYGTIARCFLDERFGRGAVDLRTLCAGDMIAFMQRRAKSLQPPALKCVATGMRSFLRYAQYRGEVDTALAAAVPSVAAWTTTPAVPKAISAEHARRAIDSWDLDTAVGLCDRAVLLLLARLGLRAHEVHGGASGAHITARLALEWVLQAKTVKPAERARRLGCIRGFARYRSATDPHTEVPLPELLPQASTRARPYLYTEQEVRGLLEAALQLPTRWPSTPLRPLGLSLPSGFAQRHRSAHLRLISSRACS
jgi:site-specific recombinase XerD